MEWSRNHGYLDINPFRGMKLKIEIRPRDQRDRLTEKELKEIFQKENYIYSTRIVERRYELYWVPLISLFSGMRLGEICPLYLDNIRKLEGHHRNRRWCFDIVEEPDRPDKHLKTKSSRSMTPWLIWDWLTSLINLKRTIQTERGCLKNFHMLTRVITVEFQNSGMKDIFQNLDWRRTRKTSTPSDTQSPTI